MAANILAFAYIGYIVGKLRGKEDAPCRCNTNWEEFDHEQEKSVFSYRSPTPKRIATLLQMPIYLLCYSTTRVIFSPDMYQNQFRTWACVFVFFIVFMGFLVTFASRMFREAMIMMAIPPNITLKNLHHYLKQMKEGCMAAEED